MPKTKHQDSFDIDRYSVKHNMCQILKTQLIRRQPETDDPIKKMKF